MRNVRNIILISILAVGFANAQDNLKTIEYNELLKLKVDESRFTFGWLGNVFSGIPCFRDYTKSDIQTELINPKNDSIIYTSSEPKRNGLIIVPNDIKIDRKSKTFKISGKVTGSWESVIPTEFKIYIGQRNDTISSTTLSPNLHGDIYFNGQKVDSTIVIETVPAFYMSDLQKFEVYRGKNNLENSKYKEMVFDINGVIDEKSILVFGLSSRYAEIFEIGKLLTE
ncbi:MAG: hypothetical protein ACI91R_002529 [Vicingaceae bacterium]|jgi:hypothetical protein